MVTLEGIVLWNNQPDREAFGLVRKGVGQSTVLRAVETPYPKVNPIQSKLITAVKISVIYCQSSKQEGKTMRRPTKSFAELCNEGDEHGVRQWLTWIHQKPEERVDHLNVPGLGGIGHTGLMNAIYMGHTSIVNLLVKDGF